MANPKLKTWRRESLSYETIMGAEHVKNLTRKHETEYLKWWATQRGWFTDAIPCTYCVHGAGSWLPTRRILCPECGNSGTKAAPPNTPDINKANEYVSKQRCALENRAAEAVQFIEACLQKLGWRPLVPQRECGSTEEYDQIQAAADAEHAEKLTAWYGACSYIECVQSITQAAFEWGGVEFAVDMPHENYYGHVYPHRHDNPIPHRWHLPGRSYAGTLHVNIYKSRTRYHGPPDRMIIIEPGRAPDQEELLRLLDEALPKPSLLDEAA